MQEVKDARRYFDGHGAEWARRGGRSLGGSFVGEGGSWRRVDDENERII